MERHVDALCESAPSDPAFRTVDPLSHEKALLETKIRKELSHRHALAGNHLDNIFQYMDWLTTALLIDESTKLPPSEVYEWLRNLIGGLDKAFEELFHAAILHYKGTHPVDIKLLHDHDNLNKIEWLRTHALPSLALSDDEIALIEKINIGNALQYTARTHDAVDPTADKPYALFLKQSLEYASSYMGVEGDYCVKTGGKESTFQRLRLIKMPFLEMRVPRSLFGRD